MVRAISAEASVEVDGGQLTQSIDRYLRGEATRFIERGGYIRVNAFLTRQMKKAVEFAVRGTDRKYPNALSRDPRRHPSPNLPHLRDSWESTSARGDGNAQLINTHPKAGMLLLGFDKPSTITPKNFTNKAGVPVLMFPKRPNPSHLWAANSQAVKLAETVVRPVPPSQRSVAVNDSVGYRAIRQAFRNTRGA